MTCNAVNYNVVSCSVMFVVLVSAIGADLASLRRHNRQPPHHRMSRRWSVQSTSVKLSSNFHRIFVEHPFEFRPILISFYPMIISLCSTKVLLRSTYVVVSFNVCHHPSVQLCASIRPFTIFFKPYVVLELCS
jgi:hypothetical protein